MIFIIRFFKINLRILIISWYLYFKRNTFYKINKHTLNIFTLNILDRMMLWWKNMMFQISFNQFKFLLRFNNHFRCHKCFQIVFLLFSNICSAVVNISLHSKFILFLSITVKLSSFLCNRIQILIWIFTNRIIS